MRQHYREPAKEICNALLEYAAKRDDCLRQIGEQDRIDDKTGVHHQAEVKNVATNVCRVAGAVTRWIRDPRTTTTSGVGRSNLTPPTNLIYIAPAGLGAGYKWKPIFFTTI